MRFRLPLLTATIHGQIAVVTFICLLIVIVAGARFENWFRTEFNIIDVEGYSDRVSAIAAILKAATPSERLRIVDVANRTDMRFSLLPMSALERFTMSSVEEPFADAAADWLFPPDGSTVPLGGWRTFLDGRRVIAAKVDDSSILVLHFPRDVFMRGEALTLSAYYLLALVTLIVLFSIFAAWAITRPLRRIASAAMKADISFGPAVFEERGSAEIVTLARALNGMQKRISMLVDARTRMLRGISHDLRTPLTRLRLRVERLVAANVREGLLADIDRVDRLLKESLSYLRDNYRSETFERADLASVLQTVCSEFADVGHDVSYKGPARLIATFKPLAMTRAVTNLCDNATKFGKSVQVELSAASDIGTITVADDGPGIAMEHRGRVLEPFYKGDTARAEKDTGFGLGLSIVAEIVEAHHGRIELLSPPSGGLTVRLTIPLTEAVTTLPGGAIRGMVTSL